MIKLHNRSKERFNYFTIQQNSKTFYSTKFRKFRILLMSSGNYGGLNFDEMKGLIK